MATLYTRTIGSVSDAYVSGGGTGTITLKLVCTYTQTANNNTSYVSIYVRAEASSSIDYKVGSWQITGNGPTGSGGETTISAGTRNMTTKSKTLTHGLGGGATFSSGAKVTMTYFYALGRSKDVSFTLGNVSYALPTINVYSTLSFSPSSPDMTSTVTLNITKASSSAFIATGTKITATYDGTTTTIYEGTGSSTTWTVPNLLSTTPNSETKDITIKIQSIRSGTYYTAKQYTLTVKVPAAYVPTLTIGTPTDQIGFSSLITNYSILTIPLTATVSDAGVGVVSYALEVRQTNASGNVIFTTTQATTNTSTSIAMDVPINSATTYIKATVTDTRGRKGTATKTVSAVSYTGPSIHVVAERCDSGGTVNPMGTYAKVTVTWSITQIGTDNTVKNNRVLVYKSTNGGSTYSLDKTQSVSGYSGSFSYTIALATNVAGYFYATIQDQLSSLTYSNVKTVPKAILPVTFFDNTSDIGVSVGQMADSPGFNVYLPTQHRNHYVTQSAYPSTSAGYVVIATFTINATYVRGDTFMRVSRYNGTTPWDIAFSWAGGNTTDPTLQRLTATDKYQSVYLYKKAISTWELIIEVASGQPLSVLDYQSGYNAKYGDITVDFSVLRYATLPGTLGIDLFQAVPWSELYLVPRQFNGVDLNTFTEAGTFYVYNGTTTLNFPSGTNGALIVIKATGAGRLKQIYIDTATSYHIWSRSTWDGGASWAKWQRIQQVIEEGTSGNWNYRKYADGKAECWKTLTGSVAITTSWTGGFYRSTAIGAETFPTGLFTEIPAVFTGVTNTNGTVIFTTGPQSISSTTMGGVVNVHVGSGTYNCTNSFLAIGRWY